jgi:membrane protease YdiL (CAAX protease family)
MAVVFAVTAGLRSKLPAAEIAYLAVLSPLAEEVVFRGFAFRQLHRRAGWGFWPSVLVTALVFGLVHLEKGTSATQLAGIFFITAAGGAVFAWLFTAWGDSLAAPFALHAAMNLCWQLFPVGDTAFAGWIPTALQFTTALLAIGLTLLLRRRGATPATEAAASRM